MLLTIHDASLRKVAFIDNDKQATLNYFNDAWTRYLETGSSTFDFTVFKKAIISDVGRKRAYNYLNEKAFVSFQYKGKTYLHTIRKVEENEQIIKCYGINLNLELINEYANPYKAPRAMTFKEYCDAMDLLNFTFLKIGVNEISTQKISAEWEGTDTKLNRLLSLAKKFGAEIEFDTHLNADSSIKSFVVNVYHENDDNHQGVGRVSPTILKYGKNLKALTRTVDKTNIYNMIRPTGKDDQGNTVTISGLGAWSVNNSKGEREFYQAGEGLYAPLSMQMYPAAFTSGTMGDQWIRKDMTVESSNPEVIRSTAYRELKKNCYPAVTYEAEGFADLEIGDTVQVYDDGFSPVLLLEMRVSEQTISFTNPKNNKTTFSNPKALENKLSQGIQARLDQMLEQAKPYTIKLSTDNGVIFKNQIGQSIITPSLYKGGKPVTSGVTWRWSLDGMVTTGMTYTVRGADVTDTATLTVSAYIGNDEVAVDEISFVNVLDGVAGKDGKGITNTVITYGISASETAQPATWTASVPTLIKGQYLWTKTVWTYTDNTNETGYTKTYIAKDGNNGADGIAGKDGVGIASTTITYASSSSGTTAPSSGWTSAVPNVSQGQYLWTKTIWTYTDNTTETGYSVAKMGADGQTAVVHWAYSDNADGTGLTLTDNGQRYIGQYSDYTQADSTDKTKYRWADRWAKIDVNGRNLAQKTSSEWSNPYTNFNGTANTCPSLYKILIDDLKVGDTLKSRIVLKYTNIIPASGQTARIWLQGDGNVTSWNAGRYPDSTYTPISGSGEMVFEHEFKITAEHLKNQFWNLMFRTDYIASGSLQWRLAKVEKGTVFTGWSPAHEDVENKLDTKADQALTQEQLNLLIEKAETMQTELEARASMETLSDLERAYNAYVEANDKAVAKSEADLIEAGRRVDAMVETLGGLSKTKKFIDTYIKEAEEGIIIGTNDNVSQIRVTYDRIAMYSAGKEVMYISQGVINIDNGVFTKSLQIGRFRTEQHQTNLDINVCRYVG